MSKEPYGVREHIPFDSSGEGSKLVKMSYAGQRYFNQCFSMLHPDHFDISAPEPGAYDCGFSIGKGVGTTIHGPAAIITSCKNIRIEAEYSFNAMLSTCIPSTIYTPISTLWDSEFLKMDMKAPLAKASQHFSSGLSSGDYSKPPPPPDLGLGKAVLDYVQKVADSPIQTPPANVDVSSAPWMKFANEQLGQKGIKGPGTNPEVGKFYAAVGLATNQDDIAWCSAFANWCMKQAGVKGTGNALARSWMQWGKKLDTPRYGCVCVFSRGGDTVHGHVAFYLADAGDKIEVLGGNQSNSVRTQKYLKSTLLGYYWPA